MPVLIPMTEHQYSAFVEEAVPGYAADKVAAGQWAEGEAPGLSRKAFADLLPHGRQTQNHYLFTILDDESVAVGSLWIAAQDRAGARVAYVYDVRIKPAHRRKGHATRAFQALEEKVRALGLSGIALHVFAHNAGAHALYQKLGYLPTNINMYKPIGHKTP